jgi:predicted ATPase/DNA-binding XRE family transcriptional regulator
LKALREAAGYTQEELATIAGLSVHGISALERGQRRRPHTDTIRALSAALDLTATARDVLLRSARAPASSPAMDELVGGSLPHLLTPLIGRDAALQTLRHWLADPAIRLITLTGPGGAGKTRLALELAHGIAEERSARVVFVSLAPIRDPAFVAPAIAEALGMADVTARDLPARARAACHDGVILLADNFEQVLDAAPLIADLLKAVAPLRVMVTSRAPLRLMGEREYVVGPLAVTTDAETTSPADLARAPAVQLFADRVRDVQPDFQITAANGAVVMAICRRLDALPLAIELVAPWMKVLTVEELLRRLMDDPLLSTAGARDLPERQQTMNATIGWSYQLLDPDERRAFRRFGALPGLFSIDAAAMVLSGGEGVPPTGDEALAALAALIDKSLLLRAEASLPHRPLYHMLETIRAYAAVELAASGERDDAVEGMTRYCLGEASRARDELTGPAQLEWLDRLRDDLDNYRSALRWLIAHGRAAEAADIAYGLKYFWLIRGHAAEGLYWYEQILRLSPLPVRAELSVLAGATVLWYTQGELGRARDGLERVLALAVNGSDLEFVAHAEHLLGHVEHAAGDRRGARDRFTRSLEAFRALSLPSGIGVSLSGLAVLAVAAGDGDQAQRLLDEATSILRHAGPWFLTWALYGRAILAVRRGNPDEAIAVVRESLERIRELHDKFAFVYALVPLAAAAISKRDDAWAARILGTRDAITEVTGVTVVDNSVQDLRQQAEREARARLGATRWARAYGAGRIASIDALLKDIDRVVGKP